MIQKQLEEAYAADDHERAVRLNHEFHRGVNLAADSPKLAQLMSQITRYALESVFPTVEGWPKQSTRDHRRVLAALQKRDGEQARTAMSRAPVRRLQAAHRPPALDGRRRGLNVLPRQTQMHTVRLTLLDEGELMGVLDGLRVLDYGRFIAAPWCSALLADMGADVLRVEKREGGEDRWVQSVTETGEGGTFLQCNRNKRSLTLDSTTPRARRSPAGWWRDQTSSSPTCRRPGCAPAVWTTRRLKAIKPDIILASATAYGEGGPYSDRIGFDGAGQVMSGATYRQGLPDQPIRTVVPYADFGTALTLTIGVMMALFHRDKTGEGQHVEGALLPTALMLSNAFLIERDLLGVDKPRMGNRGTSVAPCDLYRTSDGGWVLLQIAGQPMFKRWCRLVGREELFDDPRFADDDLRWENGDVLNDLMRSGAPTRPRPRCWSSWRPPNCPPPRCIRRRMCSTTRMCEAMGYLQRVPFPGASHDVPIIETPFRMSATPGSIRRRAPLLGEHTDEVLDEIGYDAGEIAGLRTRGLCDRTTACVVPGVDPVPCGLLPGRYPLGPTTRTPPWLWMSTDAGNSTAMMAVSP